MGGVAELPLHGGHVPQWMLRVMERLAKAIASAIVEVWGPDAIVNGIANPYWFQAFNNAIGMDWDSSGSTTILLYVLRRASPNGELGYMVLGGKGPRMREVPNEALYAGEYLGLDPECVERFSRSTARIVGSLLQDGYSTYIHSVVVSGSGVMVAVQQGMNTNMGLSRRYHIDRESVEEPFSSVSGMRRHAVVNVLAIESRDARKAFLDIASEGARRMERMLARANVIVKGYSSLDEFLGDGKPRSSNHSHNRRGSKPYYKPLMIDGRTRRYLELLAENPPSTEQDLLSAPGVTPKTVRALALIADLIYGVPTSTRDPVDRPLNPFVYAYAVGGKDGVPYRFDRKTAERVIATLEDAIELARIGDREKIKALARLRKLLNPIRV